MIFLLRWWRQRRERSALARRVRLRVEQEEERWYWRRVFAKREGERVQ